MICKSLFVAWEFHEEYNQVWSQWNERFVKKHHNDVIMSAMAFQNYQPHDYLLNHLFRRRSKKTSKLRVTGLCKGNSPVTVDFPAQRASNTKNVSIWWRHPDVLITLNFWLMADRWQGNYEIWLTWNHLLVHGPLYGKPPVTDFLHNWLAQWSFDDFFLFNLKKHLCKHLGDWWIEMSWHSFNTTVMMMK